MAKEQQPRDSERREVFEAFLRAVAPDDVLQLFEALRTQREPEAQSTGAEDLKELREQLTDDLAVQLDLFSQLLRESVFQSRIMLYQKLKRGKKNSWDLSAVELATPSMLNAEPEDLLAEMRRLLEKVESGACLWVARAGPAGVGNMYFMLFMHTGGLVDAWVLQQKQWLRLPLSILHIKTLVGVYLRPRKRDAERWQQVLQLLPLTARSSIADLQRHSRSYGMPAGSEEFWEGVLRLLLQNDTVAGELKHIARRMASPTLHEAHRLLQALADTLPRVMREAEEKQRQLTRDAQKAAKQARVDQEKLQLSLTGLRRRMDELNKENQELRKSRPPSGKAPAQPSPGTGAQSWMFDAVLGLEP